MSNTVFTTLPKLSNNSLFSEGGGGKLNSRTLLAAFLLGTMPVFADDLSTPTLGADSAYTLTRVDAAGENTVTKFEYNVTTGEFTPVYYRVDLKQTEYGNTNGDSSLTYGWAENQNTGTELVENPTNPVGQEITYTYDSTAADTYTNKTDSAITNSTNRDAITGNFIKNEADRYTTRGEKGGGAGIYNTGNINYQEGNLQNAITGDFIGNTTIGGGYGGNSYLYGGAIYNKGQIGNIIGNYINNSVYNDCGAYPNRIEIKYSDGGAIYNSGTIGNITGDFIGNQALSEEVDYSRGGAISNNGGTIGNITGNFISNIAASNSLYDQRAYGGAIHNTGTIGDITGDFIDNRAFTTRGGTAGGAIYNSGTIGNLKGDFIGNNLTHADVQLRNFLQTMRGGAIYNSNTLGNIDGDFINNGINALNSNARGGAIYNQAVIGDINGSFYNNYVISEMYDAGGGAIANEDTSTIKSINGDFVNNNLTANSHAFGGAIHNLGEIDIITGNFVNNSIETNGSFAYGGAISNGYPNGDSSYPTGARKINTVNANFIGNHVSGYYASGGAIFNNATIGSITGNFIGNYAQGEDNDQASGGAILHYGNNNLTIAGNFRENYTKTDAGDSDGGAIMSRHDVVSITGDFTNNYAASTRGVANGGALYNEETITILDGNYSGNYAVSDEDSAHGGAIYNEGIITTLTGDFTDNYATSPLGGIGGAIYNEGTISTLEGNFTNNSAKITETEDSSYSTSLGGAIYNDGTITTINGNFTENDASSGSAIYNTNTIGTITGDFLNNGTDAINNELNIDKINGNFIGNKRAIYSASPSSNITGANIPTPNINEITGNFEQNIFESESAQGGAIYNGGSIKSLKGNFTNNSVIGDNTAQGGAIYVSGEYFNGYAGSLSRHIGSIDSLTGEFIANSSIARNGNSIGGAISNFGTINEIVNASFVDNYAQATNGDAQGGAIYSTTDLNIIADNAQSVFSGNYTETTDASGNTTRDDNAIYLDAAEAALSFNLKNSGSVVMKDNIDGVDGYTVNITGDDINNTTFYLLNDIRNSNLTVANTTLNTINDSVHIYDVNSFTLAGDTNFVADVDLANKEMDRFTAAEYGEHTGNINVVGMNLLSDAVQGESVTAVYFAEPDLKNNVVNGTGELPDSFQTTAYTPIYKYNVIYDKDNQYDGKGDGGYFVFAKGDIILPDEPDEPDEPNLPIPPTGGGTTGNPSDAFNPAVLATPVGNLAAGQAAMNEAFKYVFEHADAFTQLPAMERYAKINANKYALSTDFNENMPSYADQLQNKAVWFRPYTTFESMNIKNGPKVDAITYGSLVGFDGDFKEMKNGWSRIFTGYAGYMGSSLNYSGVDTTMNGGLLGFTETFYKGNFWTAITASAGASVGESHTMYGKEDYTSLLAGVGSKTGYNFEFKDGKFIIQPIMYLSYTFVNTFDYKNAAGVNIESDPLHTIQLNPSVRFIANLKGGWQPYASIGMVWNLMNESKVTANNVKLPEMSVKPYVEYGIGVQRNWADKFTAFLQAMIRNGGRNGVALTGGFRFMLGSDSKNSGKPKVKKEIKSL